MLGFSWFSFAAARWRRLILFCFVTFLSKAIEKARNNQAVIDAIGEPIAKGPWYNASLAVAHKRHSLSCTFPVSGPQGTGILQLKAVRNGGWYAFPVICCTFCFVDSSFSFNRKLEMDRQVFLFSIMFCLIFDIFYLIHLIALYKKWYCAWKLHWKKKKIYGENLLGVNLVSKEAIQLSWRNFNLNYLEKALLWKFLGKTGRFWRYLVGIEISSIGI